MERSPLIYPGACKAIGKNSAKRAGVVAITKLVYPTDADIFCLFFYLRIISKRNFVCSIITVGLQKKRKKYKDMYSKFNHCTGTMALTVIQPWS